VSDIERFRREQRAEMKKFLEAVHHYTEYMIALLDDSQGPYVDPFNKATLDSISSSVEGWQRDFQLLAVKQQQLERKIEQLR
jgi:hypothetical protein